MSARDDRDATATDELLEWAVLAARKVDDGKWVANRDIDAGEVVVIEL